MAEQFTLYGWKHPHFFDFIKRMEDKNIGHQHNLVPLIIFKEAYIGEAIELYWVQKVKKDATTNFRGTMEITIIRGVANEFRGL